MGRNRQGERGYLLLEAVMAIFIVLITLAVAALLPQALKVMAAAGHYTAATALAQEQMELLKSHDDLFWATVAFPYQTGPASIPGTDYCQTARAEISPLDPEYPSKQRIIKLTVSVGRPGAEQVTLISYTLQAVQQFLP
ncbi:type IV pilus modification PilV family protein [Sporomusa termitida]|uniref:Type II secretion system protein n=1 Tax=Sporomusa termitida TaxID=2377 RepID=A0A517DSI9_9FIRM|nr:hypothetical protein [Sporomusa termitida]QDR80325.1 hypothetical protein SPTER_16480 [Sporomusa termitida]